MREQTDYNIVLQQFLAFRTLENDIPVINIINDYHSQKDEIGDTTAHIKYSTYKSVFDDLLNNDKYTILLVDDSMITLHYLFNPDGSLKEQTLSFLPNYKDNVSSEEDQQDANISDETFFKRISNYIRIDYTELGRKEYTHALVHLHIGVFKESIRFPLQHFLYPYEFLFIIFKYLYHRTDNELKKLECNISKASKLTDLEMKKLRLVFGNIKE